MAASTFSPGGFSYAQAAKGRSSAATSQTPSSKVTSGTASPATGTFSELTPGSNWADDVETDVKVSTAKESSVKESSVDEVKIEVQPASTAQAVQITDAEESKPTQANDAPVENGKPEVDQRQEESAVSSPDMTASTSTTSKEEETGSSAPPASASDSTWESKSSSSHEQSWIIARAERQSHVQQSEKDAKKEKKPREAPLPAPAPVAPIVLQEAPIPENIWTKRAALNQQNKVTAGPAKVSTLPKKENQKPSTDVQIKASPSQNGSPSELPKVNTEEQTKPSNHISKRVNEVRNSTPRQTGRLTAQASRSDSPLAADTKDQSTGRREPVKASVPPPSVNDAVSWPTPNLAEKERKESAEKEKVEKEEDESSSASKRKKQEWAPLQLPMTYKYETTGTNKPHEKRSHPPANSDNAPRGGGGGRGGRGGLRRANGGERPSRSESSPSNEQAEAANITSDAAEKKDRAAMPPPPKPTRAASTDASHNRNKDSSPTQAVNGHRSSQSKQQDDNLTDSSSGISTSNGSFTKPFSEERRSKVQKKTDSESREETVPKPIPRRSSVSVDAPSTAENGQRPARPPPIRKVPVDSRQENRSLGENRDASFTAAPRGLKRNGRGRGGARELTNGHNGSSPTNGNHGEFSPYTVPQSPSAYHASRGNHFSHPSPRGGSYRANLRTQSIPIDAYFNPRYAPYGVQQNHAQMPQFWPGTYDLNGYPMSASPYGMMMEPTPQQKIEELTGQIEYYFSEDNLAKDLFLRRQMDSQGFIFLDVVANFNRVKQMTEDKQFIKAACMASVHINVRVGEDGRVRLRKDRDWEKWVLEMGQRDESAQNNGPERLEVPERPQLATNNIPNHFRGPQSAGIPGRPHLDRRSYDSSVAAMDPYSHFYGYGGFHPEMYGGPMMGEEMRGRSGRSPMRESVASPVQQQTATPAASNAAEDDTSGDLDISALTVVVNMGDLRPSHHPAAARTFSNGSIDSRSTLPEPDAASSSTSKSMTNGDSHTNGTAEDSFSSTSSPTKLSSADPTSNVFWVKDSDFPLGNLPQGLASYPYLRLKEEALQQRAEAVTGTCPAKLSILYQFWCHFLIRNFSSAMYEEFKSVANEDARDRYNFQGLQSLVKFYSQSLNSKNHLLRDRVAKDYVELVNDTPKGMKDAPFKELRTAWRDGALNLKNRKKLADVLDASLKKKLDEPQTPASEVNLQLGTV